MSNLTVKEFSDALAAFVRKCPDAELVVEDRHLSIRGPNGRGGHWYAPILALYQANVRNELLAQRLRYGLTQSSLFADRYAIASLEKVQADVAKERARLKAARDRLAEEKKRKR